MNAKREQLELIPLPEKTSSYIPVGHLELIDIITDNANKYFNTAPVSESYQTAKNGNQMFGTLQYRIGTNGTNLAIGFRNSYDKSLPVGIVSGASVIVCSNLMFKGTIMTIRKHTVNVWTDIKDIVVKALQLSELTYNSVLEDKMYLISKTIDNTEAAKLLGVLFAEKEILNVTQLCIAKKEWYKENKDFSEKNLWKLYNACTEGLKKSHPTEIMERHTELHKFLTN